jgi:hypothetical protein
MSDTDNQWSGLGEGLTEDALKDVVREDLPDIPPTEAEQEVLAEQERVRQVQAMHENTCPKCSWDTRNKVLKATEDDLREYTRCILADRNFVKVLKLYGGQLQAQFTEQSDEARDEIVRLAQSIDFENTTQIDALTYTRKIQIVFSLTQISVGEQVKAWEVPTVGQFATAEEVAVEFKSRLGGRSASMQSTLFRAYLEFDKLISVLSDGAFDENFYQGAGLD